VPCICKYPSKAKLPLFVPVIVVLVTLTAVVLVLLRKMSKGEPVELSSEERFQTGLLEAWPLS